MGPSITQHAPAPPAPAPAAVVSLPLPEKMDKDDVEASLPPCCRICLDSTGGRGDRLISPCMCKGTQKFVHRTCLDHWRAAKEGIAFSHCTTCKAQFHLRVEFLEDDMCRRMKFRLFVARDVFLVFLAIQACIAAIAGVAYLVDKGLIGGAFRNIFAHHGHNIVSKHLVLFYYCIGVMLFFALVGICGLLSHCCSSDDIEPPPPFVAGSCECHNCLPESGEACLVIIIIVVVILASPGIIYGFIAATLAFQKIVQRHYHILTKKELTKVYIVEDLHGGYATPPKMDPEHEQSLKMLQLL